MSMLTASFFHLSPSLVTMSIPLRAGPSANSYDQMGSYSMETRSFRKCGITVPIDGTADSEIHIEGNSNYTFPDWQLPPESEDQPDLLTDTEDESSDVEIVDDEEEADGSDIEHGDYITEEEATQYATITLGEEIM
ncbi:hypothetical protein EV426DRAFT_645006 [Tirmania nivea]|nr:hypothetical protein EV426DRAFT_645006 [Tirmania nivea]